MSKEGNILAVLIGGGLVIFFGIVLFVSCAVMLDVSQRAVVFDKFSGKMQGNLQQGLNFINPFTQRVTVYDLKLTKSEYEKIDGLSKDMQTIYLNLTINWKLDPSKLNEIYTKVQGNITDTIMYNAVIDTTKTELGKFKIDEIARNREILRAAINNSLRDRLADQYILITNVSVTNVDYSDEYENAINAKLIAEQQALEAKNRKEKVRYESEAKGIENTQLAQTITPLVLKQKWIEKWDGKLPQYMLGNNTSLLMGLPEAK